MRIGIVGAGGTGGYFGGRLAAAGNAVTFVARGQHGQALRTQGLKIQSPFGDAFIERPTVVERPEELGPQDVVLDCVKLWDLEESARALARSRIGATLVLGVQNGVELAAILSRHLPAAQVAQGIAYIPAEIASPGVIKHNGGFAGLAFGALQPAQEPTIDALVTACKAAGIDARKSEKIERDVWLKFLMLQALAGATASRRQSVGELRDTAEGRGLLQGLIGETLALAKALGVDLPADAAEKTWKTLEGMPAPVRASMALDLQRGNRLELPWLNGYVARKSAELGLKAPLSGGVVELLTPYVGGNPT